MGFDFKLSKKKIIWIIVLLLVTFAVFFMRGGSTCFDCASRPLSHIIFGYLINIFAFPVVLLISQKMFSKYYIISAILTVILEILYFYIILSVIFTIFKKKKPISSQQ